MTKTTKPRRLRASFARSTVLLAVWFVGAKLEADEPAKTSPAKVENPATEAGLTTITLTTAAEKRLGITMSVVERRKIERSRMLGGEILLPPMAHPKARSTNAGDTHMSTLFVVPFTTPTELLRLAEMQIDADGLVGRAQVQLDAAKLARQRAETLLRDKAGSARTVEEAKTQVDLAETGLRTAQARRELLGAPVLDAAKQKRLWVRVPVYVGDLPKLDATQSARVGGLAEAAGAPTRQAKPVPAPLSANPGAATVDLFYEIANNDGALRLGQKVGVTIPFREEQDGLVVPWSAVVRDIHGGAWVYENTGPQTFVRRRVQVRSVVGHEAALESGPKPGAKIVANGAAELFGTELGVGK